MDKIYFVFALFFVLTFGQLIPENDVCSSATDLALFQLVSGSTTYATKDSVELCGVNNGMSEYEGVWYSTNGTGRQLQASLCDYSTFDTQLSIYTGSCPSLFCIDGNDDGCGADGKLSAVTWDTNPDTKYYIYVYGFNVSKGDFRIILREAGDPVNDECDSSIPVKLNRAMRGTTVSASFDTNETCGTGEEAGAGVWYHIDGTGHTMSASTCSYATYDTQISVFSGSSCDGIECVAGNDDDHVCYPKSSVSWSSRLGTTYYVLVHGYGNDTGNFDLEVTGPFGAINDKCNDAIMITPNNPIDGSTIIANIDNNVESCGSASKAVNPGVWYMVNGTGTILRANTCADSSLDTQISIFKGTCDNLVCVGGNDDWCGVQSAVKWQSKLGEIYYIYVHSSSNTLTEDDATGRFKIVVDVLQAPLYEHVCNDAISLSIGYRWDVGALISTSSDLLTLCEEDNTIDHGEGNEEWYTFVGTGNVTVASSCSNQLGTNDTTIISVYKGDCDNLICVVGQGSFNSCKHTNSFRWQTDMYKLYHIQVHNKNLGTQSSSAALGIILKDLNYRESLIKPKLGGANDGAIFKSNASSSSVNTTVDTTEDTTVDSGSRYSTSVRRLNSILLWIILIYLCW